MDCAVLFPCVLEKAILDRDTMQIARRAANHCSEERKFPQEEFFTSEADTSGFSVLHACVPS